MQVPLEQFEREFSTLTGPRPFDWQRRLFTQLVAGLVPAQLDLPTGLGKTSVMAIWLLARAHGAGLPRRLVYVVDRRAVVDQATDEAEKLRDALEGRGEHFDALDEAARVQAMGIAAELKKRLGFNNGRKLPISTLRGAHVDNREWLEDPTATAIIVGTVDMIGSRLLFEGYGVSPKMRPYQAGLLGVDALVVLDEAHLVPPFAHLLRAVEQHGSLRPSDAADRALLPPFVVLPLSATQRTIAEAREQRASFHLEKADWSDDRAKKRLTAKKRLHLEPLAKAEQEKQLAEAAWALARKEGKFFRVAVFCDRRDKRIDSAGPSAQGVKDEIERLAKADKKKGRPAIEFHPVELVVGARRVRERETAARRLRDLGFIGEKKTLEKPAFLVATSAGEVGVDIDADHMVSDLVAWERMIQRLGRVNRRGEGDAEIKAFWSEPSVKEPAAPTESERRAVLAFRSKCVIEMLPRTEAALDASPGALRELAEQARQDGELRCRVEAATTPEPLRPALNRALLDAWSMSSLEVHPGRPDVAPWLRGWVDERPQTTVVWRTHMPVRHGADGEVITPDKLEVANFFEAAPPHQSEKLESETFRVVAWLQERANALLNQNTRIADERIQDEDSVRRANPGQDSGGTKNSIQESAPPETKLGRRDVVALILSSSGAYAGCYRLGDLARELKGREKDEFQDSLAGKTLVVDARLGGLKDGLLDGSSNDRIETADSAEAWSKEAKFRVQRLALRPDDESPKYDNRKGWRFEDHFDLRRDVEGKSLERLIVEHFKDTAQKEDARSMSKPQELAAHQEWARSEMLRIATAVGLPSAAVNALALGAGLHDEGKRAPRWQRAFKAARDAKAFNLATPLAKTLGPIDQTILGGYRHEFGSLRCVEEVPEFKALPEEWRDLVLEQIASHHGQSRPAIEIRGCDEGPPSMLQERANAVALRFARLQKRWGPWGLAWWEALMRAADQQASRRLEEEG